MSAIPVFKIDGKDFTSILPQSGISWSRNDLDSDGSGRTLDGNMHRARISIKRKLSIKCRRLTQEQMAELNAALIPIFIQVTYLDPVDGVVTRTFYGSGVEATTLKGVPESGQTYWENTSFSLIEQ